jgi:hypothetical protein
MPTKTPSIISVILTVVILILLGVLSVFTIMLALNGMSGNEGGPALLTVGSCSMIGIILSAIVASRLTKTFISRYSWNAILAVITAFVTSVILGIVVDVIGVFLAIAVAEFLWPL